MGMLLLPGDADHEGHWIFVIDVHGKDDVL